MPPRRAMPPHRAMPPPTTTARGEQTEDTPPHEDLGQTLTTRTPRTRQRDSTRHDRSTNEYCTGMGGTRAGLHALGGPATAHTTAIQ